MTDGQVRAMALQLAWFVHMTAKDGGVTPEALVAADEFIAKSGGFAPSNTVVTMLLTSALEEMHPAPAQETRP